MPVNIPNTLTLARIVLVPLVMGLSSALISTRSLTSYS